MSTDDLTPDDVQDASTPESKTTTPSSSTQQVDWEKRYKGLQATYDKLQKKFTDLEGAHNQTIAELEEIRQTEKSYQGKEKNLTETLSQKDQTIAQLQAQLASHDLDAVRTKLIMSDYLDLAPFEAQGLLPPATDPEDMKTKFENFRTAFKSTVGTAVKDRFAGTGPSGTGNTPPNARNKETVYNDILYYAGRKDPEGRKKYQELQAEWDALNAD